MLLHRQILGGQEGEIPHPSLIDCTISGVGSCSKVGGVFKLSGHICVEKIYIPME